MSNIPKNMRAAALHRFGGPEVLTLHHLPVPILDQNEVLIALDTVGVGPWDADVREGWYPAGRPRFPLVLGVDGAGAGAVVGSRVHRFKVGTWSTPTASKTRSERGAFMPSTSP